MTGSAPAAAWLNRLLAACKASQILSGSGYRLKPTAFGTGLLFDSQPGGGGGNQAKEYHLKSVQDDYLTCRTWNGTNEGSTDILIAKDPKNRTSLKTATVYGVVHTYSYTAGPDSLNLQRTNDDGTQNETELITPPWCPNELIYAIPAVTSLKDPNGKLISLLEVRPARQWAS